MRLYHASRVTAAEISPEYLAASVRAETRRRTSLRVAEARRLRSLLFARSVDISLPDRPLWHVLLAAMTHYNLLAPEYRSGECRATTKSDLIFLARITVDYLRHTFGYLEEEMTDLYGQPGRVRAFLILHRRILATITFAYPELEDECLVQLEHLVTNREPGDASQLGFTDL